MELLSPLIFEPLFMERVWGGSRLEVLFGKNLPSGSRIGESWEIVDREEAQSVVHTGPLKGSTLQELWRGWRADVFGVDFIAHPALRFPLLIKLLDAEQRLSVQVHPPAAMAATLGGEAKTEMWYIVDTQMDHAIFAGLKPGTTQEKFEENLENGTVEEAIERIPVQNGDAIFIPSGRIHAIGAGNVIVEVQQNSDTTYRVFDWNRVGLDGQPRELHVKESLQSIDFEDIQPELVPRGREKLVACDYFTVEKWQLDAPRLASAKSVFSIIAVLTGSVLCGGSSFGPGQFFLVSAVQPDKNLEPEAPGTTLLHAAIPV